MEKYYIIIDTGTTNTRVRLMNLEGDVLDVEKVNIGVKNTAIDGNNSRLKSGISLALNNILVNNKISKEEVKKIIASGMITSDVGLYEVPHLLAPVGKKDLRENAKEVLLSDVIDIPITFIPGVKNDVQNINSDNFEEMDIMRGEEVECIALLESLKLGEEYLFVLPGSHTKFIKIDKSGKITGCLTTLTGELLEVITNNTIISSSVDKKFVKDYEKEILELGYKTAQKVGLARSAFSTRIYSKFVNGTPNKIANFLLGAVLENDIQALKNTSSLEITKSTTVVVAGKYPLKDAIVDVLKIDGHFSKVIGVVFENEENLSAIGAFSILKD